MGVTLVTGKAVCMSKTGTFWVWIRTWTWSWRPWDTRSSYSVGAPGEATAATHRWRQVSIHHFSPWSLGADLFYAGRLYLWLFNACQSCACLFYPRLSDIVCLFYAEWVIKSADFPTAVSKHKEAQFLRHFQATKCGCIKTMTKNDVHLERDEARLFLQHFQQFVVARGHWLAASSRNLPDR